MSLKVDPQCLEVALPNAPFDMDLSNDGTLLACAIQGTDKLDHVIQVFHTKDGSKLTGYMQLGVEHGRGVAFVGGGRELVFLFERDGQTKQLYRVALDSVEPELLKRYPPGSGNHAIVRDASGERFAVLGRQVEIWDATTNQVLHTLPGVEAAPMVHAAFSRDGAHIYVYGTVEGAVVRYDVTSGKEVARWDAPAPFGGQVVVTPDERFLVASPFAQRGPFVYDLSTNQRLEPAADAGFKFDAESQWRAWAVSPDGRLLVCLKVALQCVTLPELSYERQPEAIIAPRVHATIAASCWDAPILAFGTLQDGKARCFRLR